jgi:FMN reductase
MTATAQTEDAVSQPVRIIGLGGSGRPGSVSRAALDVAMNHVGELGAETTTFDVATLDLPAYPVGSMERTPDARRLVDAARAADGIIISAPCYHGTIAGQIKTALDYLEDLAEDPARPYLTGTAMGIITAANGWNAAVATVTTVRSIAHALRAWPTPLGVALATRFVPAFDDRGACTHRQTLMRLSALAGEVYEFARMRQLLRTAEAVLP